ncbi:MAG: hypothetical protein OXN90_03205 [Gemmatimonadota bacterium]|nr:hypothetical protein [Gemmatimonadota bacterium]
MLAILCHTTPITAAPLDALRTLWAISSNFRSNPTDLAQGRTAHTELTLDHHLLTHSRRRESSTWSLSGHQDLPLFQGALRLELGRAGTEARFSSDTARFSSRPNQREYLDLSYGRSCKNRLDLGFKTRLRPTAGVEGTIGLRLYLLADWSAVAYLSRYAVDHRVSFDFKSDRLDADILGHRSAGGFHLQGDLFNKVAVYLRGQRIHLPGNFQTEDYTLAPRAGWGVYEGSITIPLTSPFSLQSHLRYRHLSSRPEGHLQGRRFMRSRATAHDLAGFLSLRYAPQRGREMEWGIFANRGELDATRGRLESWPFLNSFASVVGGKDWSFWGDADLRLYGIDFRLRRHRARWCLETATRLLRLRGGLSTTSRERSKFNIGSLFFPEEHRYIGTFQADVIDLDVRVEYRFPTWGLRYAISQLVPLRVHTSSTELAEDKRGGRQQQLSLMYTPDLK